MSPVPAHPWFVRADIAALPEGDVLVGTPRGGSLRVRLSEVALRDLLRACDGTRSLEQVSARAEHPEDILALLERLTAEGCLAKGPGTPDWARFREVTDPDRPRRTRLVAVGEGRVAASASRLLAGPAGGRFATVRHVSRVEDAGLDRATGDTLAVLFLDRLEPRTLLRADELAAETGTAWSCLCVDRERGWAGPHGRPGVGPTFRDLHARRRAAARHPDHDLAMESRSMAAAHYLPPDLELTWMVTVFLVDVERWLAGAPSLGDWGEIELDPVALVVRSHPVLPLPDRPVSGRPPGGRELLVDARTGIVTRLATVNHRRPVPKTLHTIHAQACDMSRIGPWGNDPAGGGSSFLSAEAARAAAIGETMERYCGNIVQPDLLRRASFDELRATGDHAVDPEALVLFSDAQYAAPGFPFVPLRRSSTVHWVRGRSLTRDCPAWIPASLVYANWFGTGFAEGRPNHGTYYPGLAAGSTLSSAVAAGLLEVVERHATMVWWLNHQPLARIAPTAALDGVWAGLERSHQSRWLIHLDNEFDIPVMAGVVDNRSESLLTIGFAARAHPADAALKAWTEALTLQELSAGLLDRDGGYRRLIGSGRLPDQGLKPWRADRRYRTEYRADFHDVVTLLAQAQFHLDPASQELARPLIETDRCRSLDELPRLEARTLEACRARVEGRGYEICYADITTPDVAHAGLRVVRTLVPGLVPNSPAAFPFLGREAVREAAVRLGWRTHPMAEDRLNAVPLPHA